MQMEGLHKMLSPSFFAQYMSEIQQVLSSVSMALPKGKGGTISQKL